MLCAVCCSLFACIKTGCRCNTCIIQHTIRLLGSTSFYVDGPCHVPRFPFYSLILLRDRTRLLEAHSVIFVRMLCALYILRHSYVLQWKHFRMKYFVPLFNKGDYIFQMDVSVRIHSCRTVIFSSFAVFSNPQRNVRSQCKNKPFSLRIKKNPYVFRFIYPFIPLPLPL